MKKGVILFLLILILPTGVYAIGSSTGNGDSTPTIVPEDVQDVQPMPTKVDCEIDSVRKSRIKCRLKNRGRLKTSEYDTVPEACRLNPDLKNRCKKLYERSGKCYLIKNIYEKKVCFLKESNINKDQSIRDANSEKKRDYLVLLLYELQERIESQEEEGKINVEEASELIESIVEIKQDILNGENKQVIKPKINEFRKRFNEIQKQ